MCKVYNQVGCLTDIDLHLSQHQISEYESLEDLIGFQKNYPIARQQIVYNHKVLIEEEQSNLNTEIKLLETTIQSKKSEVKDRLSQNITALQNKVENLPSSSLKTFRDIVVKLNRIWIKLKIWFYQTTFNLTVWFAIKSAYKSFHLKNKRYQYITSRFDDAVLESGFSQLQVIDNTNNIIKQIENAIYGALGELRVQEELKKLPDNYILINDFRFEFSKALYNKKENEYIKTVQIDNLLVSPAGIFLIETKNWSKQSLNNSSLRSPVSQIRRAGYALNAMLNWDKSILKKIARWHHWGDRKITVRNLIVFTEHKPNEEFEYVKIATVNTMLGYIKYFKPCFSDLETQAIGDYLNTFRGQVINR